MNDWISVKDRLPPEHGPSLVVTNNIKGRDRFGNMSHVFLTKMLHRDGDEFCAFSDDHSMMKIWGVTHWMPILPPTEATTTRLEQALND